MMLVALGFVRVLPPAHSGAERVLLLRHPPPLLRGGRDHQDQRGDLSTFHDCQVNAVIIQTEVYSLGTYRLLPEY